MTIRTRELLRVNRGVFLVALWAFLCVPAQAKRKDVVVMNNGDHFTGEVKRLQNGLLYVSTDYVSGNIGLDWNQVKSVESAATYRIVLTNGERFEGKIEKKPSDDVQTEDFLIREASEETQVSSLEIVSIDSRSPTFWRQLQGAVDFGYSFTSGNNQSSLNSNTRAAYKTPGWEAATSFDSTFSGQPGASKTNRQDFQGTFSKFLSRNSYILALSDFLHSSQQDLTLRTTFGGAYGRYVNRTTTSNLSWLAGVVYIHESFGTTTGNPSGQNMEGVVGLEYRYVRFNFGEFNSQVLAFPGLTDTGRLRVTTNNSLTINLRNNFHLAFTFWDNFDSRPPMRARKNELGTSTGIGWSF
jgi:putative salt-induced outer membrane protein YdiY